MRFVCNLLLVTVSVLSATAFAEAGRANPVQQAGDSQIARRTPQSNGWSLGPEPHLLLATTFRNDLSSEQIRNAARNVMQQNEFRSVRRRVLENIPESDADKGFLEGMSTRIGEAVVNGLTSFFSWVSSFFSSNPRNPPPAQAAPSQSGGLSLGLSQIFLFAAIIMLIGVAMWIIAAIVRSTDGRDHSRNRSFLNGDEDGLENLSVPPGELAASIYETRAMQFAADGNFRAAIRELLLGSMSWIERAGLIRFRKGLTNRDYVRAVWRQEDHRDAYSVTAEQFERVYFGRRDASEAMFRQCLNSFQGAFREEPATTTAEV